MSSRSLHILILPSWYVQEESPWVGHFFQTQAKLVSREGHQVGVIFPEMRSLKTVSLSNLRKNYFQTLSAWDDGVFELRWKGWNLFPKLLKRQRLSWIHHAHSLFNTYVKMRGLPDLIHAHSIVWGGMAAQSISDKFKIPYLVSEHRDLFFQLKPFGVPWEKCWTSPLIQECLLKASLIISPSHSLKEALQRYHPIKVNVIPHAVDTDFFSLREEIKDKNFFHIVSIGRLSPEKNIKMLILAFFELLESDPSSRLTIGGDGPERRNLESLVKSLGIESKVKFLGELSQLKVRDLLHSADLFVLTSLRETFGVVLIEALSSGLPVISTRCGGPEEIVFTEGGSLIDVGDLRSLVRAIKNFKGLQFKPIIIREKILKKYSFSKLKTSLLDSYLECL